MRVDAFTHFVPPRLRDEVMSRASKTMPEFANWTALAPLSSLESRLQIMEDFDIDLQILCMPPPPLEMLSDGDALHDLVRLANESLAEEIEEHPARFAGIATVSLSAPDRAREELERCVRDLGLKGVMLYASPDSVPLDAPHLDDFYDVLEELDVPMWIHPERSRTRADYASESESRWGLYLVFGWPYETSIAMARLVLGGVFERHPRLKVITHHAGGMIPMLAKRIELHYPEGEKLPRIDAPTNTVGVVDAFRAFYADTVATGPVASLLNAVEFFGVEHMVFATDFPFGPEAGRRFVKEAVEGVERLPMAASDKSLIWAGNLTEICRLET